MNVNEAISFFSKRGHVSDLHITAGKPLAFRESGILKMNDITFTEQEIKCFVEYCGCKLNGIDVDFGASVEGFRARVNCFYRSDRALDDPDGYSEETKGRGHLIPCLAIRLLSSSIPDINTLNLPKRILNLKRARSGIIVISGTTGSGKSTTLASLLQEINRERSEHIITLEDPVEYVHEDIKSRVSQREIGTDVASYSLGIKSAMREDPDIVLVGEMRDVDTITSALILAETGHLVLSTVHAKSCIETVDRIVTTFPADQQMQIRNVFGQVLYASVHMQLIKTRGTRVPLVEMLYSTQRVASAIKSGKNYISDLQSTLDSGYKSGQLSKAACLRFLMDKDLIDLEDLKDQIDPNEYEELLKGASSLVISEDDDAE